MCTHFAHFFELCSTNLIFNTFIFDLSACDAFTTIFAPPTTVPVELEVSPVMTSSEDLIISELSFCFLKFTSIFDINLTFNITTTTPHQLTNNQARAFLYAPVFT